MKLNEVRRLLLRFKHSTVLTISVISIITLIYSGEITESLGCLME